MVCERKIKRGQETFRAADGRMKVLFMALTVCSYS